MATAAGSGAEGVRWDLTPLAPSEEAMKERLDRGVADAAAFVERWPADSLPAIEPAELTILLRELADLRATRSEAARWALLLTWTDGENPAVLDVQAWVDDRLPLLDEAIRQFELAWMALPETRALELAEAETVAHDGHYLRSLRRFRPHMLSPAEERVLSAREASASTAWRTLRDRTLGPLQTRFDDGTGEREWALAELESMRRVHPDRDVRRRALEATKALLEPVLPVIAHCYDTLVSDRLAVDRLRAHADPMEARCLVDEVDRDVVEGVLAAAEAHNEIAQEWFRVKARLLGVDRLDMVDLSVAAVESPPLQWDDAHGLAVDVFADLSPALGAEAEAFFRERRIDAEPRRGKPSGAFCEWPSTRVPGFVFLNWTGQLRELGMLTHELGHGTHFAFAARAQSDNSLEPGVALCEIPSTFAELRLVDRLLALDVELGRAMLARTLDQAVVATFMAAAFAHFEQRAYALRAEGQALTAERLDELCGSAVAQVRGDGLSDELGAGTLNWASQPHFVHERFYTYAYTFAFLLAAGLVARSHEPGFPERYERFLSAGNSAGPEELTALLGVDLHGADVWDDGFAVLEHWIDGLG